MSGHDHGPRIVKCWNCTTERWCGSGACSTCGAEGRCPPVYFGRPS